MKIQTFHRIKKTEAREMKTNYQRCCRERKNFSHVRLSQNLFRETLSSSFRRGYNFVLFLVENHTKSACADPHKKSSRKTKKFTEGQQMSERKTSEFWTERGMKVYDNFLYFCERNVVGIYSKSQI